ncbi:MAG: hypothetical protein AB7P17_08255 [Nitrospirales bacterium]|nr:hypothetical protein [Nitrospirales bacterium]
MNSQAVAEMVADPLNFLTTHSSELRNIRSKEEALQVFLQSNPSLISEVGFRQARKEIPLKVEIPTNVQEAITQIMASLVALQAAQDSFITKSESHAGHHSDSLTPLQSPQYEWMADTSIHEKLTAFTLLESALFSLQSTPAAAIEGSNQQYRQFEEYFDTQFPESAKGHKSWNSLLKHQGLQGLHNRLEEFQASLEPSPDEKSPTQADIIHFRQHYIRSRLIPYFHSQLQYESIALQAQAYTILLTQGPIISQWQEQKKERSTLARLCGSWLWTLHNHQNHQDHKMTVIFPPPGESLPSDQPSPNAIALHGDTVYLEWVFPQGKQEDSLLLSNRDSIMEGTFKNTLGPYGSITGKRLSSCKP